MKKIARSKEVIEAYNFNALNKGKILHEFQLYIDFVKNYRVEVTTKNNTIKKIFLAELNNTLTNKLQTELKNPNQKSFPHINGLFLLSRALGLCTIDFQKGKFWLKTDDNVLEQWRELNNAEKFLNLLISWFANGYPTILGEDTPISIQLSIILKSYIEDIPNVKSNDEKLENSKLETIMYRMNKYSLALFDMFDIIDFTLSEKSSDKHWNILSIKKTIFGNALVINIFEALKQVPVRDDEKEQSLRLQALRKQFKSICSEYKHDIEIKQPEIDSGEFVFKVSLGSVWRRFCIPVDYSISDLCYFILDLYEFDHDHLFTLEIKNRFGATEVYESATATFEGKNADKYKLKQTAIQRGTSITFNYDFGTMWQFTVVCEAYRPEKQDAHPRIIEKRGASPDQYGY